MGFKVNDIIKIKPGAPHSITVEGTIWRINHIEPKYACLTELGDTWNIHGYPVKFKYIELAILTKLENAIYGVK